MEMMMVNLLDIFLYNIYVFNYNKKINIILNKLNYFQKYTLY